ncbi:hypothetical protein KLF44_04500 [Clostridium perfringens]|uniref:hypothetical protein n=1 Tax=Clostridium perfringens TaxID=1502 RepID=UPI001CCEE5BB|nr:hypothetical protein [Clostridium perfringens]UBK38679.1 hypothetical protein KLF44_04500 [Clostridium perfringens]UBK95515.1 hypothetical protein KLF49_04495 [Clostridium perfringens]
MSINSNMKSLILQENREIITTSMARKKEWEDLEEPILIAIYETDSRVNTNNARYNDSTHIGLTFNKEISSKNRLKDGDKIYTITGVNPQGRLSQVFLKVIENV